MIEPVPVSGQVTFKPELRRKTAVQSSISRDYQVKKGTRGYFIGTLLSGMLVIVLAVTLMGGVFRKAGEALHSSYWQSTGIGILAFILPPIVGFLALLTILGIPMGMLVLAIFAFSLVFARVIAAMAFAAWLERRKVSEWSTGRLMLVSLGLYAGIKIVSMVPFIGWLVVLFVVLAGYGALVLGLWERRSV